MLEIFKDSGKALAEACKLLEKNCSSNYSSLQVQVL